MNERPKVPPEATAFVKDWARPMLAERVAAGEWDYALFLVQSEDRITLCRLLWPVIPETDRAAVLANAISTGDFPAQEWLWLNWALQELHERGTRAFDCDAAREAFERLPKRVTIYRGTVKDEYESGECGVCWTLSRETAVWFATKHGRFRNTASRPVLLSATVPKDAICGLLTDRNEQEVLIPSDFVWADAQCEYLDSAE